MITNEKKYLKPTSAKEAVGLAKENEKNFRYLAGGTDVIVNKFQGNEESSCLIDITGIEELKKVLKKENHLEIG